MITVSSVFVAGLLVVLLLLWPRNDEITFTYSGSVLNGSYSETLPSETISINQGTPLANSGVMNVPTTANGTALPLGDVTTAGCLYLKNLDSTNYVQFGVRNAGTLYVTGRLNPGEVAWFRIDAGSTLYLIANTAPCKVQFYLFNN